LPTSLYQEQIGNTLLNVVNGYLVETGRRSLTSELSENRIYKPELSYTWYNDFFKGKGSVPSPRCPHLTMLATVLDTEHENYIGSDSDFGTVIISTVKEIDEKSKQLRAIVRTKFVSFNRT